MAEGEREVRAYCDENGSKESNGFCVRYSLDGGNSIFYHSGELVGGVEKALRTIGDSIIHDGEGAE